MFRVELDDKNGVKLIKRLEEIIEDPTPAKIATLWNATMKDKVSNIGARTARYYKEKPWNDEEFVKKVMNQEILADYIRKNPYEAIKRINNGEFDNMNWDEISKVLNKIGK